MNRAREYGENRVVAGVEAGRIAGSLIAQRLFEREAFRAEFEAARKELRGALWLP